MIAFLKTRWVLLIVLLVFVALKVPHLFYAYYWDESWPYAVAISDMYHHGASLLPTAIDPELSRGHPLFFHAAGAIWMNIFGSSHVSMHSFALLISVLFLICIYEAGLRLFNIRVATLAVVLVAVQVVFFVQSSFVLFEMLVAFLAFASIYYYSTDQFVMTAACLTALFYTKESGLIAGFVPGVAALAGLFNHKVATRVRLYRILSVGVPCILIGIFFLIQKHVRGWYIFPLYNDIIEHNWNQFWYSFRMKSICSTIVRDNRYYYFIVLLAISVVAAIKNKSARYLVIFFPSVILYYFVDNMRAGRPMPSILFFMLFMVSIAWMLYVLNKINMMATRQQKMFIVLLCSFTFAFFCFSAMNFFTPRYMLAAVVPLLFFAAVAFDFFISRTYRVLFYPVLCIVACIGIYTYQTNTEFGDADPGAFDGLAVQQAVVDYLETNNDYEATIGCGSFLENQHLMNPATGFLRGTKSFKKVRWEIDWQTDIAIFDNMEPEERYQKVKSDPAFERVFRVDKRNVWAEIYKRKR